MNIWSWTIDDWYTVFQVATTVFIAGTVLTGAGAIFTGRRISKRQTRELTATNAEAAKANKGVAVAGLEIAKAKEGTAQAVRDTAKANEEIARLTKEAEEAKTERAEADKQIAIAKGDAARAKEGIANAEAVSAKAGAEVARLQVVVAKAEQKRAEAEKALIELQERVKPRHLTADQRTRLVSFLRSNPKGTVTLVCQSNDVEAYAFAGELGNAFGEAGWIVAGVNQAALVQFRPGLLLGVHDAVKVPPNGGFLQQGLGSIGFPVEGVVDPAQVPEGTLLLVVGTKP